MDYLAEDRNGVADKILAEMTPGQRKSSESLSSEYIRLQPVFAQINREYSRAVIDKQTELVKAIVLKHQQEMAKTKEEHVQSHPEHDPATAGQEK